MTCTVADFANDTMIFHITGCSREELENKLLLFFASENLQLKSYSPDEKTFQRGNKVMRVLFGVFVKYFKITVSIRQEKELYAVRLQRDMNLALSGGLAGVNASRKEFTRITDAFKTNFNNWFSEVPD